MCKTSSAGRGESSALGCRMVLTVVYRLFTAFTLSTKTHQHVRVRSAQLLSDAETTGVKVKSCVGQKPGIVVRQHDERTFTAFVTLGPRPSRHSNQDGFCSRWIPRRVQVCTLKSPIGFWVALMGRSSTRGFEAQDHLPHASRRSASPLWWCDHRANLDRKSTRLNSSHSGESRMPSSA